MLFHVSGTTTFLADTIHALPERAASVPRKIWEVHKNSTHVVFETDLDSPPGVPDIAVLDAACTLSSLVPPKTFEAAHGLWNELKICLPIQTIKPWFAGIVLANSLGANLGFEPRFGADRQVWDATLPERRIMLEGIEALNAFDDSPLQEQAAYLAMVAETPEIITNRLNNLFNYWQNSNARGFEQELLIAKQQFPYMFSRLIDRRNEMWLPIIIKLAEDKTPSLVLVGALHLIGESGLPNLLNKLGYSVNSI